MRNHEKTTTGGQAKAYKGPICDLCHKGKNQQGWWLCCSECGTMRHPACAKLSQTRKSRLISSDDGTGSWYCTAGCSHDATERQKEAAKEADRARAAERQAARERAEEARHKKAVQWSQARFNLQSREQEKRAKAYVLQQALEKKRAEDAATAAAAKAAADAAARKEEIKKKYEAQKAARNKKEEEAQKLKANLQPSPPAKRKRSDEADQKASNEDGPRIKKPRKSEPQTPSTLSTILNEMEAAKSRKQSGL